MGLPISNPKLAKLKAIPNRVPTILRSGETAVSMTGVNEIDAPEKQTCQQSSLNKPLNQADDLLSALTIKLFT